MSAVYRLRFRRPVPHTVDFEIMADTPADAEALARKGMPHVAEDAWQEHGAGEAELEFVSEVIPA